MSQAAVRRPSVGSLWAAGTGVIVVVCVVMYALAGISASAWDAVPSIVRVTGIALLSLIPAATWLAVIRYQDRTAPEPRAFVFGLFMIGVAAAEGIVAPLTSALQLPSWAGMGMGASIAAGLIHGVIVAGVIYAAVRWTVYPTAHFDQHLDGIVYAVAVAMGLATAEGMAFLLGRETRLLGTALSLITVDVVLLLAIGTVVGYLLSMCKFDRAGTWVGAVAVLSGGIILAAGDALDRVVTQGPLGPQLWQTILPAVVVMAVVLAVVTLLVQRGSAADSTAATSAGVGTPGDTLVIAVLAVCLVVGVVLQQQWVHATKTVTHGGVQVALPAGLLPVRPGAAYPARSSNGVEYTVASRPSAGSAAVDVEREVLGLASFCTVYPATTIAQGTVLEYVCLPANASASVTHSYMLIHTDAQTTYTITVSGAEARAATVAAAWDAVRLSLAQAGQ